MTIVSFLHQKGGTGKSTLAISSALALAQSGRRVMVLDTDYQGTSSEWGNRFARRFQIEIRSQVQPIVHTELARFQGNFDWILIDGPPSLSEMTESICKASEQIIIPVRPSLPDVWALPWLAAIIQKLRNEGQALQSRVVFNQYGGEDLAPLREEVEAWNIPVYPDPLPADPAFAAVFSGHPLPGPLAEKVLELLQGPAPGE